MSTAGPAKLSSTLGRKWISTFHGRRGRIRVKIRVRPPSLSVEKLYLMATVFKRFVLNSLFFNCARNCLFPVFCSFTNVQTHCYTQVSFNLFRLSSLFMTEGSWNHPAKWPLILFNLPRLLEFLACSKGFAFPKPRKHQSAIVEIF